MDQVADSLHSGRTAESHGPQARSLQPPRPTWCHLSPFSALRLLIGITLVAVGTRGVVETDIWGHLRFGLDWLATNRLPAADPYSFTSTQPWINHEWLSQVLLAFTYAVGGLPMLALLRATAVASLLVAVDRALCRTGWPLRDGLLAVVVVAGIPLLNAVRPQIFSLPLYAITLLGVSQEARWLPLIFFLWANLHGGWMIGLGAVVVRLPLRPSRRSALILAGCAAATLATPYGPALWRAMLDATSRGWADVEEWQPVYRFSVIGVYPAVVWTTLLVATIWGAVKNVKTGRFEWVWTACVALAALRAQRLVPFFAVTTVMLFLSGIRGGSKDLSGTRWSVAAAAVVAVYCAGTLLSAWVLLHPTASCLPPLRDIRPEASAVEYIRSAGLRGRTVMWFDWGLYAIWHVGDRLSVSIDNRRETVYSVETVASHHRFYAGDDPGFPDRIGAKYAWLPSGSAPVVQLQRLGWYVLFRGPRSVILSRAYAPTTVGGAAGGAPPCFPNP